MEDVTAKKQISARNLGLMEVKTTWISLKFLKKKNLICLLVIYSSTVRYCEVVHIEVVDNRKIMR